jgi:hypothetical protein
VASSDGGQRFIELVRVVAFPEPAAVAPGQDELNTQLRYRSAGSFDDRRAERRQVDGLQREDIDIEPADVGEEVGRRPAFV